MSSLSVECLRLPSGSNGFLSDTQLINSLCAQEKDGGGNPERKEEGRGGGGILKRMGAIKEEQC